MNTQIQRIRIGASFLVLLVLVVVGITMGVRKIEDRSRSTFQVSTVYSNSNGLKPGYKVRYNGINVGVIDQISFLEPSGVRVDFSIDTLYRRFIHTDVIASIGSTSLLGDNLIDLSRTMGSSPLILPGQHIQAKQPVDYGKLAKRMQEIGNGFAKIEPEMTKVSEQLLSGKGSIGILLNDTRMSGKLQKAVGTAKKAIETVKKSVQ